MGVDLTGNQIDKAGARLREYILVSPRGEDGVDQAIEIVERYRAAFVVPLQRAQAAAAKAAAIHTDSPVVARHKRTVRVIDKLTRFPSMRLSQMDDIGGCRIVVGDLAAQQKVLIDVLKARPAAEIQDYVANPKRTGYRAIHAVVLCDELKIEIQIRTDSQNNWADVVERTSDRLNLGLKDGKGDADLLEYFRLVADKLAIEETGGKVDEDLEQRLAVAWERARPFLVSRREDR